MSELTHFNRAGEAHMVDVGAKDATHRMAIAEGYIAMEPATLRLVAEGGHKKGDVLGIARVAGIMASKRTADLVPICHPIAITSVEVFGWKRWVKPASKWKPLPQFRWRC